mmetsp:Transcript_9217/g.24205  ORF Transcript_9217/g.24205 Transcript_9217/m.24205 type:complete len:256 (-) Transcript_9217:123-890(-)
MASASETNLAACRSLESLSLGGVAAMAPETHLPRKYRAAKPGEKSTYKGAGVVPVTRLPNGEARILLWQPQSGKKAGVRWYDFGGKKSSSDEFTSSCACRKFAKKTYGLFGCQVDISNANPETLQEHLEELYQGLCNLPLMLKSSQDWAQTQILSESPRIFYNDVHEYHTYMLGVPYVAEEVLNSVSKIVDGGKRVFRWLGREDTEREVLAARLHTESFMRQVRNLNDDSWVNTSTSYEEALHATAAGSFSAMTI